MQKKIVNCSTGQEEIVEVAQSEIDAAAAQFTAEASARIMAEIAALEAQQTPRRMREAVADPAFINGLDAQIAALRAQL